MTKIKFLLTFIIISITTNSFSQDYLDEISQQTCDCAKEISDSTPDDEYTTKLGICMIQAATPYEKQLKEDHQIDLSKMDTQGEELGQLIGFKMIATCPETITKIASMLDEEGNIKTNSSIIFEGEVIEIKKEKFIEFLIKNKEEKVSKFHWLSQVQSEFDIENQYEDLLNKKVSLQYTEKQLFDFRINEYKSFKVIEVLNKK